MVGSHDTWSLGVGMALQVIGAGFGRTGTATLKQVLEQLGFGPCHHMFEVRDKPAQLPLWEAVVREGNRDWDKVFAGYASQVDWPGCRYWRELADHFPAAKVILSTRPEDAWLKSFEATIASSLRDTAARRTLDGRPHAGMVYEVIARQVFGGDIDDPAHVTAVFREHNAEVQRTIAPERLLVWSAPDGWRPLCDFLGVDVPDTPFPHTNSSAEFKARRAARAAAALDGS